MSHVDAIAKAKVGNLGQLLLRAARIYNEICVGLFQEIEPKFTLAHTRIIPYLDIEGGTRPSELARRSGMSKQSMNQLLNELDKMGMITRVPCPDDGRARLVVLTEEGHKSMLKGLGVFKELERQITEVLPEGEIEETKRHLEHILQFLEEIKPE